MAASLMRCRFLAPSCVAFTTVKSSKVWLPSKLSSPRPVTLVQIMRPFFSGMVTDYCSRDVSDESADTESEVPEKSMLDGEGKAADEKTLNPKEWQEIVRSYSHPMNRLISFSMTTETSAASLLSQPEESMHGDGKTALQPEENMHGDGKTTLQPEVAQEDYSLEKLLRNVQKARLREDRQEDKTVTVKSERVQRSTPMTISELVEFLQEENAKDICAIRVPPEREYVNYLVTCAGTGTRHIGRMADSLAWELRRVRETTRRKVVVEGRDCDDWMAVDLGTMVVHFLTEEAREKYELEKLWTLGRHHDDQYQSMQKILEEQLTQ